MPILSESILYQESVYDCREHTYRVPSVFADTMFVKFFSTADIASSYDESDLVILSEIMDFTCETLDMFMVKSLTTITEGLSRELEKETHRINKKEEMRFENFKASKKVTNSYGSYCIQSYLCPKHPEIKELTTSFEYTY